MPKSVLQIKIVLNEVRPIVWRRVQLPLDITLDELHLVLQAAMGWTNSHLHAFQFGKHRFSASYEEGDLEELDMEDERNVSLVELITEPKQQFAYQYDFGDSWEHTIILEKIALAVGGVKYPVCIAGKRACPPEDCGGTPGYASLLRILRNPANPEYKEMRAWVGRKYDPDAFDPLDFVKNLRSVRRNN